MNRIARGMAWAMAASVALHAGLVAFSSGHAVSGSASNELAYVRTRLVVAPESPETKPTPTSEAPAAEPSSPTPEPSREEVKVPAELPSPTAGQDATLKTPAPAETPRASEQATAAKEGASARLPATAPASSPAAANPSNAAAAGMAAPAAAPLAGEGPDPGPALLTDLNIERPASAGRQGGSVTLLLLLSPQGAVEKASVLQSTPPGVFDAATLKAIATARFKPALRAGVAIQAETVYEVEILPLH